MNHEKDEFKLFEIINKNNALKELPDIILAVLLNVYSDRLICFDTKNDKLIDLSAIKNSSNDMMQLLFIADMLKNKKAVLNFI
jgi:hypothetical protein